MKKRNRQRYLLNLLSLALLAVALYLNFVKKDTSDPLMQLENGKQPASQKSKIETQTISANQTVQTFVLK
jgi:hypothetical protein